MAQTTAVGSRGPIYFAVRHDLPLTVICSHCSTGPSLEAQNKKPDAKLIFFYAHPFCPEPAVKCFFAENTEEKRDYFAAIIFVCCLTTNPLYHPSLAEGFSNMSLASRREYTRLVR